MRLHRPGESLRAEVRHQIDGGYAEPAVADARCCFELPAAIDDAHAAPLLCAGQQS
jgi:D-arabinose 1-dehydrogenase-like Zn-dependent alcohol dehydrogenase